jgi:hypothetical protein
VSDAAERVIQREFGNADERAIQNAPATAQALFFHPRQPARDFRKVEPVSSSPKTFVVRFVSAQPGSFEVVRTFDGSRLVTDTYSETEQDYSCVDSFVSLRVWRFGKGSDRVEQEAKFTRAADGALIYFLRIESEKREMLVFNQRSVIHYWYRFLPASD